MSTYEVLVVGKNSGTSRMTILQDWKSGEVQYLKEGIMASQNCRFEIPQGLNVVNAQLTGIISGNAYISCDSGQDIKAGDPLIKYYGKGGNQDYSFGSFTKNPVGKDFNINESLGAISSSFSVSMQPDTKGSMWVTPPFNPVNIGSECGRILSSFTNMKLILSVQHNDPIIDNLSTIGEFWERDITVNWRSEYQEVYEYELFYNNGSIKTGSGTTQKEFVIPAKTFSGTLPASVRVRVKNTRPDGVEVWSNWTEKSISLKDVTSTISNLLVEGEYWESPIKVSWRSTDQEQYKLEIIQSNVVIKTYTGTTETSHVLSAEELPKGQYVFRVSVAYAGRFVNSNEKSVNLKDIVPSVNNLALSGSNIDLPLTFRWVSENQQKYEVQILKDSEVVKTYYGTNDSSVTIPNNELTTGQHKFMVRVGFKDRWSEWETLPAILVETLPSIGVLEPDGIILNKNIKNRVWWTSTNQSKYSLTIDALTPIIGTTETEYFIEAGELSVGNHTISLVITYITSAGVEKQISKKAEFKVQGKPPTPTITSGNIFDISRPVITWDTQDQQGYRVNVLKEKEIIWATGWLNGLVTRQKVLDFLHDGNYTVGIQIINEFSVESEWSYMDFSIHTAISETINLRTEKFEQYVHLEWDNMNTRFDLFYVLRDGKPIAKISNDVVYEDYTARGNHYYEILGVTGEDVGKYSNTTMVRLDIEGCFMATIGKLDDIIEVGKNIDRFTFGGNVSYEHNLIQCTGRTYGVSVFGEHRSTTYNFTFIALEDLRRFLAMCDRRQIFCYRDRIDKMFVVVPNPRFTRDALTMEYVVTANRVDYNEVIRYD